MSITKNELLDDIDYFHREYKRLLPLVFDDIVRDKIGDKYINIEIGDVISPDVLNPRDARANLDYLKDKIRDLNRDFIQALVGHNEEDIEPKVIDFIYYAAYKAELDRDFDKEDAIDDLAKVAKNFEKWLDKYQDEYQYLQDQVEDRGRGRGRNDRDGRGRGRDRDDRRDSRNGRSGRDSRDSRGRDRDRGNPRDDFRVMSGRGKKEERGRRSNYRDDRRSSVKSSATKLASGIKANILDNLGVESNNVEDNNHDNDIYRDPRPANKTGGKAIRAPASNVMQEVAKEYPINDSRNPNYDPYTAPDYDDPKYLENLESNGLNERYRHGYGKKPITNEGASYQVIEDDYDDRPLEEVEQPVREEREYSLDTFEGSVLDPNREPLHMFTDYYGDIYTSLDKYKVAVPVYTGNVELPRGLIKLYMDTATEVAKRHIPELNTDAYRKAWFLTYFIKNKLKFPSNENTKTLLAVAKSYGIDTKEYQQAMVNGFPGLQGRLVEGPERVIGEEHEKYNLCNLIRKRAKENLPADHWEGFIDLDDDHEFSFYNATRKHRTSVLNEQELAKMCNTPHLPLSVLKDRGIDVTNKDFIMSRREFPLHANTPMIYDPAHYTVEWAVNELGYRQRVAKKVTMDIENHKIPKFGVTGPVKGRTAIPKEMAAMFQTSNNAEFVEVETEANERLGAYQQLLKTWEAENNELPADQRAPVPVKPDNLKCGKSIILNDDIESTSIDGIIEEALKVRNALEGVDHTGPLEVVGEANRMICKLADNQEAVAIRKLLQIFTPDRDSLAPIKLRDYLAAIKNAESSVNDTITGYINDRMTQEVNCILQNLLGTKCAIDDFYFDLDELETELPKISSELYESLCRIVNTQPQRFQFIKIGEDDTAGWVVENKVVFAAIVPFTISQLGASMDSSVTTAKCIAVSSKMYPELNFTVGSIYKKAPAGTTDAVIAFVGGRRYKIHEVVYGHSIEQYMTDCRYVLTEL